MPNHSRASASPCRSSRAPDFVIGPASTRLTLAGHDGAPPQPDRRALALRRAAAWIGRLNLLLALAVLLLAVALVRGLPD
ncbi:MAG: hypothetical protein QN131_13230 [Armatimonadota bacterium]|nr:hypothetical protein [Armatimonadota bacterium]